MENREIIGYETISNYDLQVLNERVGLMVRSRTGWEPYNKIQTYKSGISMDDILYTQTMVQYARPKGDE